MALMTRVKTPILQRRLHRQRVHHRGQHAHVVGGRAFHPLGAALQAAKNVAAADHHADLDPKVAHRFHLLGNALDGRGMQAIALVAHQRLARDLKHHAAVFHRPPRFRSPLRTWSSPCISFCRWTAPQNVAKPLQVQPR
jgi:hypothetical protein